MPLALDLGKVDVEELGGLAQDVVVRIRDRAEGLGLEGLQDRRILHLKESRLDLVLQRRREVAAQGPRIIRDRPALGDDLHLRGIDELPFDERLEDGPTDPPSLDIAGLHCASHSIVCAKVLELEILPGFEAKVLEQAPRDQVT